MTSSLFPDPMQFWRDALSRLESDANDLAAGSLKSIDTARGAQKLAALSLSLQQISEKAMGEHLRRLNLPSRKEVQDLAETLRRIEGKLDQLLPHHDTVLPRPARTRRPATPPPAVQADGSDTAAAAATRGDAADAKPASTRSARSATAKPAKAKSANRTAGAAPARAAPARRRVPQRKEG